MQTSKRPTPRAILAPLVMVLSLWSALPDAALAAASNQQQAVQIAMDRNGGNGKVLSVSTVTNRDGSIVFAVKILSNGRVRVFRIPKIN